MFFPTGNGRKTFCTQSTLVSLRKVTGSTPVGTTPIIVFFMVLSVFFFRVACFLLNKAQSYLYQRPYPDRTLCTRK